ncbi:Ecm29p NDAI_0H00260 [Naumovozyma dairenensis CBS 421]|uniref:Proteasome component ECM29 n=1 Tax=Naumovozyma dairenensis (strain ATCC 10597 / BCRC 20456 / CBS 421 / NBRC 0211 / NRRL Y-12639) TaxID=1071378 RepID=G0WEI9_NAUDC|nr:hypothetical protein NDAI_0H00260 [Naumovozyma dairenensis CBS 421]CCD26200.1 hypothetical protein NDAI_0H00260 [Naumovozyma dairenensis CBS 421]
MSSPGPTKTALSEQKELELIEKVELKLAFADNSIKYQQNLDIFLAPLLLKLNSIHDSVRKAVFNSLKNILSRLNTSTDIKLPISKLLNQVHSQSQSQLQSENQESNQVILYSLLLISKGIDRLSNEEKHDLVPQVMNGISKLSSISAKARTFHILCKLLLSWNPPLKGTPQEQDTITFLHLPDSNDFQFLLNYFTKFFFLIPAKPDPQTPTIIPRGYTCPGLSKDDVSFFTYSAGITFNKDQLLKFKWGIFKFVTNGFVSNDQVLIKFISVVSTDQSSSSLSEAAIQFSKRLQIPHEDIDFIQYLIDLYTGDKSNGIPPVNHFLQEKILIILNSSIVATSNHKNVSKICSIGLNSSHFKLRSLCLNFIRHVTKYNHMNLIVQEQDAAENTSEDFTLNINIASLIRNNLHAEGWPRLQLNSSTPVFSTTLEQRRLQYETLGDILKKNLQLISDFSFIEFLFDSLIGDLSEFRSSIQEALLSLSHYLYKLPPSSKEKLKKLARTYLQNDDKLENDPSKSSQQESKENVDSIMSVRFILIKFINATFPFDDQEARLFNIFGTSPYNKFDIIEQSFKGLHPYWFRIEQASIRQTDSDSDSDSDPDKDGGKIIKTIDKLGTDTNIQTIFPNFKDFIDLILSEIASIQNNNNNFSSTTPTIRNCLNTAVRFSKQALISQAIQKLEQAKIIVTQDEDWSIRIEKSIELDDNVSLAVNKLISQFNSDQWFHDFLKLLCAEFIIKDGNGKIIAISNKPDVIFGDTLLTILKLSNVTILQSIQSLVPDLFHYLEGIQTNTDKDLEICANVLAIITSSGSFDDVSTSQLLSKISNIPTDTTNLVSQLPVLYVSSYIIPRLYLRDMNSLFIQNNKPLIKSLIDRLISSLNSTTTGSPRKTILKLISQVLKYGLLSILDEIDRISIVVSITQNIRDKLINDEIAIATWGYLSLYSNEFDENLKSEIFYEKLFDTYTSKQVEFLFTTGEVMSILAGGWNSKFLLKQLDLLDINPSISSLQTTFNDQHLDTILDKVLKSCDSTKPSLRKASCIWLLSILQYLGHHPKVISQSSQIHLRFMKFLADRDEFLQESAARGLSLVYEIGNADLKETMIKGLLRSFTDSTSAATTQMTSGSLSEETTLFEPGMMNTGDGSVSTYKDILNLASEVGDPSLVYKFMSLAKSSSLWSSRKGIAFGIGAIISKSSLEQMLLEDQSTARVLIPKLFRYRFDPYSIVSRSMNDIWNSLISNSSAVISKYFDDILKELLTSMSNKEWRVREASTNALLQLIQTQPQEKFNDQILDIWTMGFRVMDDIKESVREAGTKFTTVLSKILARSIDISNGVKPDKSKQILDMILPFLLGTKGLNSDAEEVRKFSLTTLIDLVKNTGTAIKPYAPELVYDFTLLFSSIEPQVINYLTLNAKNYNIDAETIDIHRQKGVIASPLFETIDKLISKSDDSTMEEHINYSIKAVKKSVGLPSKIAASQVMILLVKRYGLDLKSYTGKMLKVCMSMLDDRNESVNMAFAVTIGRIYNITGVDKAVKYAKLIVERYFNVNNASSKNVVGVTLEAILNQAPASFENLGDIFIPLIFIGSSDVEEKTRTLYSKIWTEASTSGAGAIKLYLNEILNLVSANIVSNDFGIRRSCAKSVSTLCHIIDGNVPEEQILKLFEILNKSLIGRSWDGKDLIVDALVSITGKFDEFVKNNNDLKQSILKTCNTEVSRNNDSYVKKVILSYANLLKIFPEKDLIIILLSRSHHILNIIQEKQGMNDEMKGNENNDVESSNKRIKTDSDVSKKSSKSNIEKEEYVIKLLHSCADICEVLTKNEDASLYSVELLDFVVDNTISLFENETIIYTWRTQIAGSELGIKLTNYNSNEVLDEVLKQRLSKLWNKLIKYNSERETIENVKLKLIKFGGVLMSKFVELRPTIEESLRRISELDETSRIVNELKNIGL